MTLAVEGIAAGGQDVEQPAWTPSEAFDGSAGLNLTEGKAELSVALGEDGATAASRLRLLSTPEAAPVPLLASSSLTGALGIATGDTFELTLGGTRLPVRLWRVGTVPGALDPYAALLDRGALAAALVREVSDPVLTNEVWLAAGPPGPAGPAPAVASLADDATEAAEAAGTNSRERPPVTTPGLRLDRHGRAGARLVLARRRRSHRARAWPVVLAVAAAMLRERRGEVIVLRAVGLGPAAQGRARAAELVTVGVVALVVGAVAGWGVARLAAGGLAAATLTGIDAAPPAQLVLATGGTGLVLAAAVAGLVLVAVGVGGRVAAQARDTTYREEVR